MLHGQAFPDYFVALLICTNCKPHFADRNLKHPTDLASDSSPHYTCHCPVILHKDNKFEMFRA